MKIIDFRCRPCTQEWAEFLNMPFQAEHVARGKTYKGLDLTIQTPKDLIQEMDISGVAVGVTAGRDLETTLGWKWDNDKVAQFVNAYPDRLIGYAGVDPNKGMDAIREIDRAVELGLKGVSVDPFLSKVRINDKKMYPIYAKCVENRLPIMVTTGMSTWGGDWAYMKWCTTMDVDEPATDFPELIIICSHAGFPWAWEMLSIAMRHSNIYIETSGISAYESFMGGGEPYYKAANGVLGDRFVFGSAKPYGPIKAAIDIIRKEPYNEETLGNILFNNGARILGL
ncbi:amidohydrolase family protein [Chloroflexota bacterium]